MASAPAAHQIRVSPQTTNNHAGAQTENLLHELAAALTGGEGVYDFFSGDTQALTDLYQTISTSGDSVWIDGTNEATGMPMQYVANGNTFLSVGAQLHDKESIKNGTSSTTDYKQVGSAYITLTTDQGTSLQVVHDIEYAGEGIAGIGILLATKQFVKAIVKVVKNFVKNLCSKIYNRIKGGDNADNADDAEDGVDDAAVEAGDEAGEAGADVGGGVFADVSLGAVEAVGAVIAVGAIAVVLILELLEKQMTNWGKFFNATSQDLQFGIGWMTSSSGAKIGPAKVGETGLVKKIGHPPVPPGVMTSDTAIYRADTQFINEDTLGGIGYVLSADPAGDFPGFRVMVDIPAEGDNSLFVTMGADDCKTVWNDHQWDPEEHNDDPNPYAVLTSSVTSGKYTLRIATNQLKGQSPSPIDAADGYNYEHLLVLTDGTVTI